MKVFLCIWQKILKSTENLLKSCKKALKINLEIHGGIHKLGFGGFHKLQRGPSQIYGR